MNTLTDTIKSAGYHSGHIIVSFQSGVEIKFPILGNNRLAQSTVNQLNNIEVSPLGLHWPDLDEDLSLTGILAGDYGQHV